MTKKNKIFALLSILILSSSVSACAKMRHELGFGRNSPDEFTVVKRAPLTLPPEYDLLPPDPDQNIKAKIEIGADAKAKTAVFGNKSARNNDLSDTPEDNLLNRVGVDVADKNIRKKLDRENGYIILDKDKGIVDKIIFWNDEKDEKDSIIDAVKEQERIKQQLESQGYVDGKNVPIIEKKKSTIDKLFD